MNQITNKMLEIKLRELNKVTGQPRHTGRIEGGQYKYNVGNYHLEMGVKGVNVLQTIDEEGEVTMPIKLCTMSRRELWIRLCSFIDGFKLGKTLSN